MFSGTTAATPPASTGLVQSAVTSMPDNSSRLVAVTTGGGVEFASGTGDGHTWQNWQTLSLPAGVTAQWAGVAGMPNGSAQLIAVSSTGRLWHTVRNANGSWQGWNPLPQPGVKIVDASIAGLPDGSAQILEVTSTGVLKHNVRYAGGAWQAGGWGVPGGFGSVKQASISSASPFTSQSGPGTSFMSVVTSTGAVESAYRNPDGSWTLPFSGTPQVANWGTAVNSTVTTQPDGAYVKLAVVGG